MTILGLLKEGFNVKRIRINTRLLLIEMTLIGVELEILFPKWFVATARI